MMKSVSRSSEQHYVKSAFLFLAFAVLGGVAIYFLKYNIDHPILNEYIGGREVLTVIFFPIGLMILYLLLTITPVFRFRLDQTGDNLYYLGFIYTLCSLSVALWNVALGATADEILRAFGLAIGSTIFGIAMRVVFNQRRTDVHEVEQNARLELSEAAERLTRELDDTVTQLESFRNSAVQAMTEGFGETQKRIDEIVKRVLGSYDELAGVGGKSVKSAATDMTETLRTVNSHVQGFSSQMEEINATQAKLVGSSNGVVAAFETITDMQRKATETDNALREELRSFVGEMKNSVLSRETETEQSQIRLNKLVDLLEEYRRLSRDTHNQSRTDLEQLLSEVSQSTQKQVDEISKLLELLAVSVREERQVRSELRGFTIDFKDRLEARDSGIKETVAVIQSLREDVAKSVDQNRKLNAEIKTCVDALSRPRVNRFPRTPGSEEIDYFGSRPGFWKNLFGSRE